MTGSSRRGTGALWISILGLALAAATPGTAIAVCTGGACSAPGGGSLFTDCLRWTHSHQHDAE